MSKYTPFIRAAIDNSPIEAKIVRKVYKAMKDAGNPITQVWDSEDITQVKNQTEMMEIVFNLDEAWLMTKDRSWVRIVLGNEWDALADYTIDLEEALKPVSDWIDRHN